ncbi:MAG: hypothetical protein ABIV51_08945 [Saprospiraceae bacterium]
MRPDTFYHLYTHSNGFEDLFREDDNYRYFLSRYLGFVPLLADTFAYCLMPNHLHFIVRVKSAEGLIVAYNEKFAEDSIGADRTTDVYEKLEKFVNRQIGHLFNSYTQAFNKKYDRRGKLFLYTFKKKEILTETYLKNLVRYIHYNPVHHGFTKQMGTWKWNSYSEIVKQRSLIVNVQETIDWFGGIDEFVEAHRKVDDFESSEEFESSK